ncbi:hypothetical protein LTSEALA_1709 [Salmonella enterica subsp. enterica serovar Alachua str. R6-377]|uniref:Uncharacterized protein n=1 Tax=Salmonella enterica subsp. enterica serovar Alachua str. R6-377 TaxID=913241 RepID=G5LME0_SALET|nr:hypothetical protein LTSEALA_1709 [Salmonella enterica subsp. enterica serovar Alachua str. R6-377]
MAHLGLFKQILFETDNIEKITLLFAVQGVQCKSPQKE